ncbi:hypothetical protein HNO51_15855 [Billgrantia sulfidoxydans]|uniref:Uncharacterized protein n=1 Tax=Billgrantia sulfidoxydans TaxID=2733484 RepID=A0ABX7W6T7_9GAMM|nr:hypothetical protein [Halomonas sulfidoxydans]QTP56029.1 hypothetical protein HNO51_15855 [Halomonas sulfidoxydans]
MPRNVSRKLLIPALLAVAIAPLSLAAVGFPGKGDGGWSEQQQERFEERRQALFERAGLDEETRRALEEAHDEHRQAMRELHERHRERMDEILDEEQRDALREARQEMRREMHGERHQDMQQRLTTLVDSWALSDEERERLTELRESLYADVRELRDQQFDSREERREAWQALRDQHREALGEVLSEEQIAALEAFMQPRHRKGHGGHHGAHRHG